MSSTPRLRSLNIDNINPHVKVAQYAVRGELAIKSEEYRAQLKKGDPPTPPESPLPFKSVISANIGNPQQLDQKPITFFRQVLALCENKELLDHPDVLKSTFNYPQDAIDRARWLLKGGELGRSLFHVLRVCPPSDRVSPSSLSGEMASLLTIRTYISLQVLPEESIHCCTSFAQSRKLVFWCRYLK